LVRILRPFRLVASLAARCRALSGARPRRDGFSLHEARRARCPSQMTSEEIEDVVRALILVVKNLEVGPAKQSLQEAFTQVRAYGSATSGFCQKEAPTETTNETLDL
jgi:hypothetical protein